MAERALAGLRVIDISQGIGGGYCTKLLAGLGAHVLKIEPPGRGDETRSAGPFPNDEPDVEKSGLFLHLGTGKRSITLNLESAGGRGILKKLVRNADVLVESYRPGTLVSWGLSYDELTEMNRELVLTSITWFGQTGPYSQYSGSELAAWALGGYLMLTGTADREPLKAYGSLAQYQAGLQAAIGTMTAVLARDALGRGQHVDVSAAEALTFVLGGVPQAWYFRRQAVKRVGARLLAQPEGAFYPSTLRPCKDGWIHAHANIRHPDLLAALVEEPRLLDADVMGAPTRHADLIDEAMDRWLAGYTKWEVVARAQELRLPFTAVQTPSEVFHDPSLHERNYFVTVDYPSTGTIEQPGAPFRPQETPWRTERAPLLGEHNHEVYVGELGYAPQDLVRLRDRGVI